MADPALNLSQEQAWELTERGGAVLFHGVPRGLEVGIDYKSWTVTERFLGFKMVPPGMHIVFYAYVCSGSEFAPPKTRLDADWCSMRGPEGEASPRTSFFQAVDPGQVVVVQWNPSTEQFEAASEEVAVERERGARLRAEGAWTAALTVPAPLHSVPGLGAGQPGCALPIFACAKVAVAQQPHLPRLRGPHSAGRRRRHLDRLSGPGHGGWAAMPPLFHATAPDTSGCPPQAGTTATATRGRRRCCGGPDGAVCGSWRDFRSCSRGRKRPAVA